MEHEKEETTQTELITVELSNGAVEVENLRSNVLNEQNQFVAQSTHQGEQSITQSEHQSDDLSDDSNLETRNDGGEMSTSEINSLCRDDNLLVDVMETGEVVEGEFDCDSEDIYEDQEEMWHLAHATAVEPEVILFAVPADTQDTQWFGDNYVKKAVLISLFLSLFTILSLACTILVMTNKHIQQNEEITHFIECIQFPEDVDCPSPLPSSHTKISKNNKLRTEEENVIYEIALSVSDLKSIKTFGSPQNKSLQSTYTQIHSNHRLSNSSIINRYILGVLYFSLDGSNWRSSEKWLTSEPFCRWEHIECTHQLPTHLLWSDLNLSGSIPKELTHLKSLKKIDFGNNAIVGWIPDNMDKLENLEILLLNENGISGTIPESITQRLLRKLSLDSNYITGAIPNLNVNDSAMGNASYLHENLSSISHAQTRSNHLEYLNLSGNRIIGSIPESIRACSKLQIVALSNNRLGGPIPKGIVELKNLRVLELQSNNISGTLVDGLGNLSKLEKLDFSYNNLSGSIPKEVCDIITKNRPYKVNVDCDQMICDCCAACNEH